MDYFGINSADDLPKIKEVLAEQVIPTIVNHTDFEQSDILAVSDSGELISADETADGQDEKGINGQTIAPAGEPDDIPDDENGEVNESTGETLADEAAEEDFISDEIFAAEDEIEEEKKVEDELAGEQDLPDGEIPPPADTNAKTDEEKNDDI